MRVDGVAAIVTGGSSGLGAATVECLARAGAAVVVIDRNPPVEGAPVTAFVQGDVVDPTDVLFAIAEATRAAPLRVLVNCAGIGSGQRLVSWRDRSDDPQPHDYEQFRRVLDVNLTGTFNCMRLAVAEMMRVAAPHEECQGVVVNTASIAAFEGQVGQIAYAAAKAGVVGMTLTAARDLGPFAIRVNTIAPGLIDTPILDGLRPAVMTGLIEDTVFPRRPGRPAEFAGLVEHLVANDFINGEVIRLDAGSRLPPMSR
jgi:NAD(P)-dependent dehydrogenase (short-subunit alcohol dehydrogenase family)